MPSAGGSIRERIGRSQQLHCKESPPREGAGRHSNRPSQAPNKHTRLCKKKSPHLLLPLFPPHPPPLPVPPTPRLHRFNQQHSADSIMLIALYYSSARCARDSRAAYSSQNGDRLRRAQQEELPRADFQNLWSKISQFVVIFA